MTGPRGQAAPEVRAAGGVVWRRGGSTVELLLVHRPRYDDWSLPKGKVDHAEEGWRDCAAREVEEETGHRCAVGPRVETVRYHDRRGRSKEVRYYAMEAPRDADATFRPNDEVDEIAWLEPGPARDRMTHESDKGVVDAFLATRGGPGP